MGEILFRGKTVLDGKWVYGYYIRTTEENDDHSLFEKAWIYDDEGWCRYDVIQETVGQFTGLKDKYGVNIFGGDILKDSLGWVCLVKWDDSNGRFLGYHKKPRGDTYVCYVGREPAQEIIGNIHDNPELLGDRAALVQDATE